jgi:site-specific DNA-cytosine methylase
MPRLLELFSGTASIGRAFVDQGWEVVSVDLDPKANATITANILMWDYKIYEPGYFDSIWASPVCTHYSIARTTARTPRDLDGSDKLVQKVIDIIEFYKPASFFMENPKTGLMKTRAVVAGIPFKDISYCKYGYRYKKSNQDLDKQRIFQARKIML